MTEKDLYTNIQSQLVAQTWTGSSNVVFPLGSVVIVPSIPEVIGWAYSTLVVPFCLIEAGPQVDSDPEHDEEPDLIRLRINCGIFVAINNDNLGTGAIMSANVADATLSEGQGILAVEQEFYNAVGKLNALESVTLQVRQKAQQGAKYSSPGVWRVWRLYQLEAWGVTV